MPKALMLLFIPMLALPGCALFAPAPLIVTPSVADCTELIPSSWGEGVAPAPLPEDDTVGSWISALDAQTGKLEQANARTKDVIELCKRVNARNAKAINKAT